MASSPPFSLFSCVIQIFLQSCSDAWGTLRSLSNRIPASNSEELLTLFTIFILHSINILLCALFFSVSILYRTCRSSEDENNINDACVWASLSLPALKIYTYSTRKLADFTSPFACCRCLLNPSVAARVACGAQGFRWLFFVNIVHFHAVFLPKENTPSLLPLLQSLWVCQLPQVTCQPRTGWEKDDRKAIVVVGQPQLEVGTGASVHGT